MDLLRQSNTEARVGDTNISFDKGLPLSPPQKKRVKVFGRMQSVQGMSEQGIDSFKTSHFDQAQVHFISALTFLVDGKTMVQAKTESSDIQSQVSSTNTIHSKYDEGLGDYLHPVSVKQTHLPRHAESALFFNVGLTRLQVGEYLGAIVWFQYASKSLDDVPANLLVRILHAVAFCNFRCGDIVSALDHYQRALHVITDSRLGKKHLAAILNCMGVMNFNQRHANEKVIDTFKRSLALYKEAPQNSSTKARMGTVLNNLGRLHYLRGEYADALKVYKQALEFRRESLGPHSIDLAATVHNIGQTLLQSNKKDEALSYYQQFLTIAESSSGQLSKDVSYAYRGIAEILHSKGQHQQALENYLLTLNAQLSSLGPRHPEVATTLNKLGNVSYEMKNYEGAMQYYKEGLMIEQEVLPKGHQHTIITLTNIAHIHKQMGNHRDALKVYRQVHDLQVLEKGSEALCVAETLSSIGLMEYHLTDYDSSFESYQEALRVRRQIFGSDDHADIASTLNSIGLVLFKQTMLDLAKKCFVASLEIRTKLFGKDHRDVAILWYNIATIYFEMGEHEMAVKMYKETLRVERKALGEMHPDVILTMQHLGQIYQQIGQSEEAVRCFEEALQIERQRVEPQKKSKARILNLLGNLYLQLGEVEQMMECYTEASRLYQNECQPGDLLVIAGFTFYGLSKTNPICAATA